MAKLNKTVSADVIRKGAAQTIMVGFGVMPTKPNKVAAKNKAPAKAESNKVGLTLKELTA